MATILVTGSNGQLGSELQQLSVTFPQHQFYFTNRQTLAIENKAAVDDFFAAHRIHFCINCAAYTAVDKAETETEKAMETNAMAVENLAKACTQFQAKLIHISTDYVFNGTASTPYKEEDATEPVNAYGGTKLKGEENALAFTDPIVIRTSWVYSSFGNNFVKTMLRLMAERENLNVVNDQLGSPTYAEDLAKAIMHIINATSSDQQWPTGIYHYSNEGVISWYDFAVAIARISKSKCIVHPIPTSAYPTPAKRPSYSVFNKEKIQSTFQLQIPHWEESLAACILKLQKDIA